MVSPPAIPKKTLLDAADKLLAGLQSLRLVRQGAANDAFEYWLWACTVDAARQIIGPAAIRIAGLQNGRIRLRTGPSYLTTGSYTSAVLTGQTRAVELHTGIYVEGLSGAEHELDVVALNHPLTVRAPATGGGVSYRDVDWAIEAKLYATAKPLPLSIPRAILGSAYDLGTLPGWRRRSGGPWMALVSSAKLSVTGSRLFVYRDPQWGPRIDSAESVNTARVAQVRAFLDRHILSL